RDGLRSNSWIYYYLTPPQFGLTDRFLDYSDITYSDGYFYGSCIIGTPPNSAAGLLLYRIPLQQLWDGASVPIVYYTTTQLGGYGSYRLEQGPRATMYAAAHQSTSTPRVYERADSASPATLAAPPVSTWRRTPPPAPRPARR